MLLDSSTKTPETSPNTPILSCASHACVIAHQDSDKTYRCLLVGITHLPRPTHDAWRHLKTLISNGRATLTGHSPGAENRFYTDRIGRTVVRRRRNIPGVGTQRPDRSACCQLTLLASRDRCQACVWVVFGQVQLAPGQRHAASLRLVSRTLAIGYYVVAFGRNAEVPGPAFAGNRVFGQIPSRRGCRAPTSGVALAPNKSFKPTLSAGAAKAA